MNKSHRSIWNESLGAWVAASEITSARGKKSKTSHTSGTVAIVAIALLAAGSAFAVTNGGTDSGIASGSASVAISSSVGSPAIASGASSIAYLLWSWRRLAVLMRDLYKRADAMQSGIAALNIQGASRSSERASQDGWEQVVDALDRGRDAEQQAQRQRAEALQLLSHDLRAPHSAILALLQSRPNTDADRALLNERIERQVRTSLGLADDFVLQMRARDDRYALQDVDLTQLMTEVYERAWPLARKKDVRLVLTLPSAREGAEADAFGRTAYWLAIEPRLMSRAFFNLIENAIKYSHEGGRVEFALESSATGSIVVTVTDEGAGIAAVDLPRLFDRYSRFSAPSNVVSTAASTAVSSGPVASPSEVEPAGHGLGLSLVKTVVDRHGGTVACRSEVGYGTLFTVTLPRTAMPQASSVASE